MPSLKRLIHEIHHRSLWQVLGIYLVGSWVAYEVTQALTEGLGLPDWVPGFAVVLLIIGLPIVLATAFVQEGAPALSRGDPTLLPGEDPVPEARGPGGVAGARRARLFTWPKAILGGVLAFALLGVTVTGYMTMRALGIGPVGSLVAAGVLEERERTILADFSSQTGDTLLAAAVTEAFRIDLAQSPLVTMVQPRYVAQVLERMERPAEARLDVALATEVAIRDGIRAVISGEINTAGVGFVLSTQLISAADGAVLAAYRESADDSTGVIRAIDRLSRKLRERIGESLKTIRSDEPLERVTTGSLAALRKYSQAIRALDLEGDFNKSTALLEEAIALDSAFAMAHRKLGIQLMNLDRERSRWVEALTKAYEHRDRLTERERYLTLGTYYQNVSDDGEKAINAYRALLDAHPDDPSAMTNLAIVYGDSGDKERMAELFLRALELNPYSPVMYWNAMEGQVGLGAFDAARSALDQMAEKLPGNPILHVHSTALTSARGDYEVAEEHMMAWLDAAAGNLSDQATGNRWLAYLALVRGRLAEAERYVRDAMAAYENLDMPGAYLGAAMELAHIDASFRRDLAAGNRRVEAALDRHPLTSMAPLDRPYLRLAYWYAFAGQPERARAALAEYEATVGALVPRNDKPAYQAALGASALAEQRAREAIEQLRPTVDGVCLNCYASVIGLAFDLAGEPDSALATYERYVTAPFFNRVAIWPPAPHSDPFWLGHSYERLGELYEERKNAEKAVYYYGKLLELWKDADPELQPRVSAARRAISALSPDQ